MRATLLLPRKAFTFDDVCLVPQLNAIISRLDVNVSSKFSPTIPVSHPFVAANMDTVICPNMASALVTSGTLPIFHRFTTIEQQLDWFTSFPTAIFSCGVSTDEKAKINAMILAGCKRFCIDVAHGHSTYVADTTSYIRDRIGADGLIIAGNVCTPQGFQYLAEAGANVIKVGVGPGSVCRTRMVTGFGVPQFTAILECAERKNMIPTRPTLIADGGIRNTRDAILALAAGADLVMMGGIFAKTIESAGNTIPQDESLRMIRSGQTVYSHYRGQASENFQSSYYGRVKKGTVPEGIDIRTRCDTTVSDVIEKFTAALRSAMTYCGAETIDELHARAEIRQVTQAYVADQKER